MEGSGDDLDEVAAHVVAHEVRAPVSVAAQLVRVTADAVRDGHGDAAELAERLDLVANGLEEAVAASSFVVETLRPPARDRQDHEIDLVVETTHALPGVPVAVDPAAGTAFGRLDVVREVLADLGRAVDGITDVRWEVADGVRCVAAADAEAVDAIASLARVRLARNVSGGKVDVRGTASGMTVELVFPRDLLRGAQ